MNLLVTGAWIGAQAHIPAIEAMGHRVVFLQWETEPLPCEPAWVEGVICNSLFLHHPIEGFPNLRYIQTISAGLDRVDLDYVAAHGIELHNARGVYSVPMAEFAVGGVLQLYKQAKTFFENQKSHLWQKHRDLRELCGKTVTVLGCGSVGTECAKRFRAFGCRILGVDLFPRADANYDGMIPLSALDRVLPETDVLVLTLPLTKDTRGLIGADRLARLKRDAVLVNIARGPIVDEAALTEALRSGSLSGAVLDVFETEPLTETSPLWDMQNVILTPHNSFAGEENGKRMQTLFFQNLSSTKEPLNEQ